MKIKAEPSWRFREFLIGHDAMVTAPDETADLIHEIATENPPGQGLALFSR